MQQGSSALFTSVSNVQLIHRDEYHAQLILCMHCTKAANPVSEEQTTRLANRNTEH